jgi:hypothetical protein
MKGPYSGQPGVDWHLAGEASTFQGSPLDCRGELHFVNQSDSKVKVRALQTQTPPRTRKDCKALIPSEIALSVRIAPHSEARVQAALRLPADTAPGLYQAIVVCGKHKLPIDIEVTEHHELELDPGHISVRAAAGETIKGQILLTNAGNTPVDLTDVGMVWLREQNWIGRTLVYNLRETGDDETYEDFANRLLHRFHDEMIASARIVFDADTPSRIGAGQRLIRHFSLTAPAGMKKGRRYLGFIKINENRIWLEIYCTGSAKEQELVQ